MVTDGNHSFDAVVIGSGMGGLVAASLLAKAGRKVLVAEQHDRPGGCAQTFRRRQYVFDAAVHLISGCEGPTTDGDGLIAGLLNLLEVDDRCRFVRVDPFYTAVFPGYRHEIPLGKARFIETFASLFPKEADGIRRLIDLASELAAEVRHAPTALSRGDAFRLAKRFPAMIRYQTVTFGEVMDKHLSDPQLKALIGSLWPYCGLPPSQAPFLYSAALLMNYIEEGAYHCEGSFKNMVMAFVAALKAHGGELALMDKVERIAIADNKVQGVVLAERGFVSAPVVISNADATQTFRDLVGHERLPDDFVARLQGRRTSVSAVVVYAATSADVRAHGMSHEVLAFPSWDHDANYGEVLAGRPGAPIVTVPTLSDASLAPAGEHLITITQILPYECVQSWQAEKDRYVDMLLGETEKLFPGIRETIGFVEGGTPHTIHRYTLNHAGAMYGWEASPKQAGAARLGHHTPVEGLYLAGHWSQPGGGVYSVVQSGVQTAQLLLGHGSVGAMFDALGGARPMAAARS